MILAALRSSRPSATRVLRAPLTWILASAALYRLLYLLQVGDDPTFTVPIWDAAAFDAMARSFARGQGLGMAKAYYFGPLYAYALGSIYLVIGVCLKCVLVLQHLLGVVICGLTYALGRRCFGRGVGLLAAGVMAISGPAVFYEGKLLMETLVSSLLAAQLLILVRSRPRNAITRYAAAGFLLGLAAAGRPSVLVLAPLSILALAVSADGVRRRAALCGAVYLAGLAAVPLAITVRNLSAEGVLVPITSSGGYNFYIGNARHGGEAFLDKSWLAGDGSWNGEDTAESETGRRLDSAEVSRYWFGKAWRGIRQAPLAWLGVYAHKLQLFFNGRDVPQIEWYSHARSRSSVLGLVPNLQWFFMAAAVAGLAVHGRRSVLLTGNVLAYAAALAFFFVTTRYRVAMLPYLAIFAAAFATTVIDVVRRRFWRRVALLVAVALLATVFTSPRRFPANTDRYRYAQHLHDGYRYMLAGRHEDAKSAYRLAQTVLPRDHESYLDLAIVMQRTDDLPQAMQALEQAAARSLDDPEVPYYQGVTLYRLGRYPEAEAALHRSLQLNPLRALTHSYLGLVLSVQGRLDEARAAFVTSLERDPRQSFTHANYGAMLAMQGDLAQARNHLEHALELDPENTDARRNLAVVHLDTGDRPAAERELRRVLELAPDDDAARDLLRDLRGGGR